MMRLNHSPHFSQPRWRSVNLCGAWRDSSTLHEYLGVPSQNQADTMTTKVTDDATTFKSLGEVVRKVLVDIGKAPSETKKEAVNG